MIAKKCVEIAREAGYGGYDKTVHSKCNSPEWYGIKRVAALDKLFKEPAQTATHNSKKKPARVYARLTKSQHKLLQRAMRLSGYKTVSEAVQAAVVQWIMRVLEKEKTAAEAEAPTTVNTLKQENYITKAVDSQIESL